MYASSFLVWTVGTNIFDARTKDERLVELFRRYMVWCKENRIFLMLHLVWPFLYSYVTCSNPGQEFVMLKELTCIRVRISHVQGIPNGCRAKAALFVSSTLQNSSKSYPAIGQKKLNGAASRMMLHFAAEFSREVLQKEPSDLHRRGFKEKLLIEISGSTNFMVFNLSGCCNKLFLLPETWCPL